MQPTSKKIVFFGTENFSLRTLKCLIDGGYSIAAVVTKPDSKKGRGHLETAPAVKVLAHRHNIPILQPSKLSDIEDTLKKLQPAAGVLVSYGKIIPRHIIDLFEPGIINVHPSLLPKYRGPSPIESAIKNGDNKTGITIMKLVMAMDAGPIYITEEHPLNGTETRPELYTILAQKGANLLASTLPKILDGSLEPQPQNDSKATYCDLIQKTDGIIDPLKYTSDEAERSIRAYLGFPKSSYMFNNQQIIITKAHSSATRSTRLDIRCNDNRYLIIDELITPNGRKTSAAAYLRGLRGGLSTTA